MQPQFERLTDGQWEIIKEFLNYQRKRKVDLRQVVNAILFITRTGIQWRNLSQTDFPHWQAVYYYFDRWTKNGVLHKINYMLNKLERIDNQMESSPSLVLADSQSVKLAPTIYEYRGTDGFKQVNGRKRHIITDTMGRIYECKVHAANIHDSRGGIALLDTIQQYGERIKTLMTDKGYRGHFAEMVSRKDIKFEVPKRQKHQKGFAVEAQRWVVERTFAWLNYFRRVVIDYEHTPEKAEAFVILANISMSLWRIGKTTK